MSKPTPPNLLLHHHAEIQVDQGGDKGYDVVHIVLLRRQGIASQGQGLEPGEMPQVSHL